MLIAPVKPNGLPRPVQIPDMFRAVVTSLQCSSILKSREILCFLESGPGRTDPQASQRGLSKDGCSFVVKEIQRFFETHNALDLDQLDDTRCFSPDLPGVLNICKFDSL